MSMHPDNTLEHALRAAGADVQCLWQLRGPKDTAVAWIECLMVNARHIVLVQTFKIHGWTCYVEAAPNSAQIDATIAAVITACGIEVKP